MQDDRLTALLAADIDKTAASFEQDGFADKVLTRIRGKQRGRAGILIAAGAVGAALAAAQFQQLLGVATSHAVNIGVQNTYITISPTILASAVIACALLVTVLVVRQET